MIRWHRRLGVAAAALVAVVAVTGVLLNHADRFGLDRRNVSAQWLMAWYGMEAPAAPTGYATEDGWVTQVGDAIHLDDLALAHGVDALKGAAAIAAGLVVATTDALMLFTADGRLVERLGEAALPGGIEAIGRAPDGLLALRTPRGAFVADRSLLTWYPATVPVRWVLPARLPPEPRALLARAHHGAGLPWSRVLLDLHTGRIFGRWGPLAMDAAALGLLVIAATGLLHWFRHRGATGLRS
jgi:hypothetical protein